MIKTKQEKNILLISRGIISLVVLGILGFIGFRLYPIIHGPRIHVETLTNGETLMDSMIRISGIADYTQQLIVNGKELPLSPTGSFDEKLILNPGYNLVTIAASDRYGKTTNRSYIVVLKEPAAPQILTLNLDNKLKN